MSTPSVPDALVRFLTCRERQLLECRTCHDIGMLEDSSGNEDACPACEGGIWRELESWRWFFHRQSWWGWRINLLGRPRIYRDFSA